MTRAQLGAVSALFFTALISGLTFVPPLVRAQSTVMVSETLGSGSPSGAPGYDPDRLIVVVGINNTITWTNDDVGHNHTVTSIIVPAGAAPFNSGNMVRNHTYTLTLTVPGLYRYGCSYHVWMTGTIDVVAAKSSGASGIPTIYLALVLAAAVAIVLVVTITLRWRFRRRDTSSQGSPLGNAVRL